jgi:Flp pilus assembly protein CpaB
MKNKSLVIGVLVVVIIAAIASVVFSMVHKPAPPADAFKVPPPTAGAHPVFVTNKRMPAPPPTIGGGAPQNQKH